MTLLSRRRTIVALAAVTVFGQLLGTHQPVTIRIGFTFAKSDLGSLARRADAIALVEPTGKSVEHWNSADNKRWGDIGSDSFIYRDVEVRVVKVVFGKVPGDTITIRGLGGTADAVRVEFEAGGGDFEPGGQYLVFLAYADFPMKEGTDPSWTAVRLSQGVFARENGRWLEPILGLTIEDADVQNLGGLVAP